MNEERKKTGECHRGSVMKAWGEIQDNVSPQRKKFLLEGREYLIRE